MKMTKYESDYCIDTDEDVQLSEEEEVELDEPSFYKVILHDDDFTSFDFVVSILMILFGKTQSEALKITFEIHKNGTGVAGVFTHEIAEQKATEAMISARDAGYPLIATFEEI